MKAMIFAAGLGTRLRPLTDHIPKALVPLAGRPLLDHTIKRLQAAGVQEIVINLHHFGEQIVEHLELHPPSLSVRLSDERQELLDTGGGLRAALPLFSSPESPILIHNVDILSNAHLAQLYQSQPEADVLLLVSQRPTQRYLLFNPEGRMVGWTNIATGEVKSPFPNLKVEECQMLAFSGIQRIHPRIATHMPSASRFPIMPFYIEHCDRLHIYAHSQAHLQLLDVGKQESLAAAEAFLKRL